MIANSNVGSGLNAAQRLLPSCLGPRKPMLSRGTPPRWHRHTHDRADGPNSNTSLHMLRRSVNKGYEWKPPR